MKQCLRCGQQLNDNEQYCTRCGGTNFRPLQQPRPQQQQPQNQQMQQPRPQQPRPQQPRPQQPRPQQPYTNISNNQQVRPQINRPNQPNQNQNAPQAGTYNPNTYNPNTQNNGIQPPQQTTTLKLKKMSRKEKQSKEMELLYAKKAAQDRGEYFDDEMFKKQHGWYIEVSTNSNKNNANTTNTTDNSSMDNMSVGSWLKTLLIMLIPIINIVVALLGIKNNTKPTYLKNYYKAFIIYYIAAIILSLVLVNIM